ncbi:hypothetical protein AVEN_127615-1 [Araneus ventricosus]|uniref:Uncharacterized protein n=1 Tax=Araneus ventricosus TaxID=182803 RepID=A0A4Y2PDE8_ARAVE|nr:hypothetical protein AVEN_127615-1 [Araneus ventricosus]
MKVPQRYILAQDKRALLYSYDDWNYVDSNGRRAHHNGQYHFSKINKQQNRNTPSRNHQESFSSPNIEQETSSHQASNYSSNSKIQGNSPAVNVNSPVEGSTELSSSESQNISSHDVPLPLPIGTSANSLLNSRPRGISTISIPSVSIDGEETSSLTQIYPILDSRTTDIDSEISDWIRHDNLKNSTASPSSDDSNRLEPSSNPSFLEEKIANLKTIINLIVEPSRKEQLEIINQMEVFLTQSLKQCQNESSPSCHCNHRDQVPLKPSISHRIDQMANPTPSSLQSVSKKPALLLHPVQVSSIEIPVILSEVIPSSDYDIHNIRPI